MSDAQAQSWHTLMDLRETIPTGWTLIGGQLVHLHCAERGASPQRPTDDIDTVLDVRARPNILATFTNELAGMGFVADTSGSGAQHRWRRGQSQIDVLIPEGIGERAAARHGASGAPSVQAPGATQALDRTEVVEVSVAGRTGTILRPTLVGALVGKAAARTELAEGPKASRHCADFMVLAGLVTARDFRDVHLTRTDRTRLVRMIAQCRNDLDAMLIRDAERSIDRLMRVIT